MRLNSIQKYVLVLPVHADERVLVAKEELVSYLQKICGQTLEVVADDAPLPDCAILLDRCAVDLAAYKKLTEVRREDGFILQTEGERLVVCGKTPTGTLYAVYHFLENFLGVDWFTPTIEKITPPTGDIRCDVVYDFPCQLRIVHGRNMQDERFRARHRLNFTVGETNNRLAYGHLQGVEFAFSWGMFGHTHEVFIPYKEYFKEHPEYFSFAEGHYGEDGRYQLCLTNPEVYEIILQKTMRYLEQHPDCKVISISQNDSYGYFAKNYCTCPNCMKIAEEEEAYSAVNLQLVNRVADEVAKKYPRVMVHTFCYEYTRKPPKAMRVRDNVIVQLCLNLDFGVSLTDSQGEDVKRYVDGWRAIAKNLYIWTYPCLHSLYSAPIGNFKRIYENARYLFNIGVYGIFQQENYDYFPCNFTDLRFYMLAKTFTHPNMRYDEYLGYMEKFCDAVYGNAGKDICAYVRLLDELFDGRKSFSPQIYADEAFIRKGKALWKHALLVAKEPTRERVKALSVQFDFAYACYLYYGTTEKCAYETEHKKLWKGLVSNGVKLFRENATILPLESIHYGNPPEKVGVRRKEIKVENSRRIQLAEANSNPDVTDFDFDFIVEKRENLLVVDVHVVDKTPETVNNANMNDWQQDSVEFFISESCSDKTKLGEGDYKLRVNVEGRYTAFGNEHKIDFCECKRTKNGYNVRVGFLLPKDCKKIGFEIMAHNMDGKTYVNTRYWNAFPQLLVPSNPSVYGIIKF